MKEGGGKMVKAMKHSRRSVMMAKERKESGGK
jgi:hypothetical protein